MYMFSICNVVIFFYELKKKKDRMKDAILIVVDKVFQGHVLCWIQGSKLLAKIASYWLCLAVLSFGWVFQFNNFHSWETKGSFWSKELWDDSKIRLCCHLWHNISERGGDGGSVWCKGVAEDGGGGGSSSVKKWGWKRGEKGGVSGTSLVQKWFILQQSASHFLSL